MQNIQELEKSVINGHMVTKQEAMQLVDAPLEELCQAADRIREAVCGNAFDICTIVNAKSGKCPEDCAYCAQSACHDTKVEIYPLLSKEEIVKQAQYNCERGVLRYSLVTSGKALTEEEVDKVCESVKAIRGSMKLSVCGSFGLLSKEQFAKLKAAGVTRIHNNLETSARNFKNICTTHTYENKKEAIQAAVEAGFHICSGGIMGLGETMEDRIDMALDLRQMGVKSVPVNMLNPIPGTPLEKQKILDNEEMCRIVAIFRFLLPDAAIRLAGGRGLLPDKGRSCFQSGANAAISGDMLTTSGITIEKDMQMLAELGYAAKKIS